MTLDTRVYVTSPVNVQDLFLECQRLISITDEQGREPAQQKSTDTQDETWRDGKSFVEPGSPWTISNEPGQDLPGWLMIHYRPGGMYRTPDDAAVHERCNHPDCDYYDLAEPICDTSEHKPACWAEVSIDTAYGYRGPSRTGCGDLHAAFVAGLGEWLDARGIEWKWLNEFTSEVHQGYERLDELVSGGIEATTWFRNVVSPAIAARFTEPAGGQR
jgi:hypothetical protein